MKKLSLLACLYVAQFLPVAFFMQTLPVFLRQQGVSLEAIGLTNLLSLPWTLKVFWSPIVDCYGWTKWGHYKSWILAMQSLLALILAFCAFIDLKTQLIWLPLGIILAISCAATQDIATDALAVEILDSSERGMGNSLQGAGAYFGGILGGGVLLILLNYAGWTISLLTMSVLVLLLLLPVLFYNENIASYSPRPQLNWKVFPQFFTRPKIGGWILILLVYMMGTTIANTMFRPFLVDLGLSLAEIGLINGIFAFSAGLVGSFVGGFVVKLLGRKQSLIILGGGMAVANAAFIIPTLGWTSLPILYLVSMGFQFTYSMACIPMYTVMMDNSRLGTAGFDYTLQISLVFVGSLLAGAMSGFIANALGYQGAFLISAALVLLSLVIITRFFDNT